MTACEYCLRRSWLLARCSARLEYRSRDLGRFWDLLALPDEQLIDAIGGKRREELYATYGSCRPDVASLAPPGVGHAICRHDDSYPERLRDSPLAPPALALAGEPSRLTKALDEKVVAILGARRASDYGMQIARSLARELAGTGVTVASAFAEGVPLAVHTGTFEGARLFTDTGTLERAGMGVTVLAGGIETVSPAHARSLHRRVIQNGCALSELPTRFAARPWTALARMRTLALLAELVIVVEAGPQPWELACAMLARSLGTPVAAFPGRVTSVASQGANALIMDGAALVRDTQDVLDLLYGAPTERQSSSGGPDRAYRLEPSQQLILERVGSGQDTVEALIDGGVSREQTFIVLAELELRGLLERGHGGRYVPCAALPRDRG